MWYLLPKRSHAPFLNTAESIALTSTRTIGRQEFLTCTWNACGCGTTGQTNDSTTNHEDCPYCQPLKQWAMQFVPRKYLTLDSNNDNVLVFCGKNVQQLVRINGTSLEHNVIVNKHEQQQEARVEIQEGMVLRLEYFEMPEYALEFEIVKRKDDENDDTEMDSSHPEPSSRLDPQETTDILLLLPAESSSQQQDENANLPMSSRDRNIDSRSMALFLEETNGLPDKKDGRNASSERMSTETLNVPLRMEQQEEQASLLQEDTVIRQDESSEMRNNQEHDYPLTSGQRNAHEDDALDKDNGRILQDETVRPNLGEATRHSPSHDVEQPSTDSDATMHDSHFDQLDDDEEEADESQASCQNTQDLMDKIMRDIQEQEKDWPSDSEEDDESTVQVEEAAAGISNNATDTATTAVTSTTISAIAISAKVVSGDEQSHKNVSVLDSRVMKETSNRQAESSTTASHAPTGRTSNSGDTDRLSPPIKKRRAESNSIAVPASSRTGSNETARPPTQFRIMFAHLGSDLSANLIGILSKIARKKGAEVVSSLESHPTHLIVSARVKAETLAIKLKYRNASKLYKFLKERNIETVKPDWIRSPGDVLTSPSMNVLWNGLAAEKLKAGKKRKLARPPSKPKPPPSAKRREPYKNNAYLSAMFHKLAKLSQECAMHKSDPFRALTNNLISGRLLQLDFEVTFDSLDRVVKISGIGSSSVNKMKQCLERGDGKCDKIEEYENDQDRMGMQAMKNIWGVGQAKAMALVRAGYRTIEAVRRGLQDDPTPAVLDLSKNALLGVQYYEDFLDKMERSEVEAIADTVKNALFERFPKANVTIMGSYRRGKVECGDIDLLITEPTFVKTTPSGALEELVHRLKARGHISHHLAGAVDAPVEMNESQSSYEYSHDESVPPPPDPSNGKGTSQSYMGIIRSPVHEGKMRRIDIKFYPFRERVFASLYFTGNGWFNRSMRRWVKRENLSLDDHGLFEVYQERSAARSLKQRKSNQPFFMASTEREVFDRLGLVYKDPTDRNFFDDVIPLVETPDWDPGAMSENEFHEDSKQHDKAHGGPKYFD